MTSGEFDTYKVGSITVVRDARQRSELTGIDVLAQSIEQVGLIHPIVIDRLGTLIAGERRLEAVKLLGWTDISIQYVDELEPAELLLIEYEENVKRKQLSWKDECDAIASYHGLQKSLNHSWTQANTAAALGISAPEITEKLMVAKAITSGEERVVNAETYSTAKNIVNRKSERTKQAALAQLEEEVTGEKKAPPKVPIINKDFIKWRATYKGKKFNFIHCDFPYVGGIKESGQGSAKVHGGYEDTEEVYGKLLDALGASMENVVDEYAHLIFWFSMDTYQQTKETLERMGWKVNSFPLIWYKSNGRGILPDAQRGPRRVYEAAFFASRGDRKIVAAVDNAKGYPSPTERIHASEKPRELLHHFFRMFVDDSTLMLDPTCGSGNSVRVASSLGAARVLGIELDKEHYDNARVNYNSE